jgi:tetratricopeptide (TPR) repeat protein
MISAAHARSLARRSLLVTALGLGAVIAACSSRRSTVPAAQPPPPPPPHAVKIPVNDSPFAPAFTKLDETAGKLDVAQMGDPLQCTGCHADVVSQWDPSAHHGSSFTNRFYASAVDLTRKEKSNKASRWCAGCHDPSLLLDGEIDGDVAKASARAGDGVGCLVCHSITEAARLGGGGYTLKWRPFVEPDVKNAAQVAQHKAAMKPSVMGQAELCASCHKVSLHEDVNGKRWYRGQNDFDPWEQGPYALGGDKTAGQIYAPDVTAQTCRDCHMQLEAVTQGDLAGKADASGTKKVRSHRFLAANTMLPTFAHDTATAEAQAKMLEDVVRVDVIAVRMAGNPLKAIPVEDAKLDSSSSFSIDVVVENDKVGHMFPTGTADSNQIWLALEVRDANGKLIADSGVLQKGGDLDPEAHTFNVMQLDADGKPALQRDAHRFAATGWNNTIGPKDARVIRYALALPGGVAVALPLKVSARVLYRKFSAAYTAFACASKAASLPPLTGNCPKLPIVQVAKNEVTIGAPNDNPTAKWRRLDAYARGLLNALQEDVGAAAPILDQVVALEPKRAEGLIDMARLFIREGRTADAMAELDLAAKIDPKTPVVPFLRGIALYEVYRLGEAVEPLKLVVAAAPKNVMAFELLAEALELKGEDRAAIDVAQSGLLIDPESAQLHHLEALGFDKLGLGDDAEIARSGYLKYRRDDDTPRLRSLCKKNVPGCAREANPLHVHDLIMHL